MQKFDTQLAQAPTALGCGTYLKQQPGPRRDPVSVGKVKPLPSRFGTHARPLLTSECKFIIKLLGPRLPTLRLRGKLSCNSNLFSGFRKARGRFRLLRDTRPRPMVEANGCISRLMVNTCTPAWAVLAHWCPGIFLSVSSWPFVLLRLWSILGINFRPLHDVSPLVLQGCRENQFVRKQLLTNLCPRPVHVSCSRRSGHLILNLLMVFAQCGGQKACDEKQCMLAAISLF